jgi:hypothetical protein
MFDPKSGQIEPRETSVSIAMQAMARRVIEREQSREGLTKEQATAAIARRIREAPGTIIGIAKARAKRIDANVRDKLTAYAIRQLEQEIMRLEHELAIARQIGADPRANKIDQVEALLAQARALIGSRP